MAGGGVLSSANAGGPIWLSAGTLTLSTSSSGTSATSGFEGWTFSDGTAAPVTQALTTPTGSCVLTPAGGPLVTLSADNGGPGFAAHSIGVTQTATSAQCNKVNINKTTTKISKTTSVTTTSVESLTVALNNNAVNGGLYDTTFGAFKATKTHLDLEVRDDSTLTAQLFDGSAAVPGGTFTLIADEEAPPASLPDHTTYCRTGTAEGGADEPGTRDNCVWDIAPGVNFDSIKLTPVAGSFSLEGGGDYGSTADKNRTTFDLVKQYDGTLTTCDGSLPVTPAGGGNATLVRLANGDPSQTTCTPLPYTFSTAADGVLTFHKPQPAGDTSQFAITLTRHLSGAPHGVPAAQVDWEDSFGVHDLPWCAGGVIGGFDDNNLPTNIAFPLSAALDQSPDTGGKAGVQYACVYKQSPVLNLADGSLTVVDYVFFTGDIKFPTA
jgi:hypothetical protein